MEDTMDSNIIVPGIKKCFKVSQLTLWLTGLLENALLLCLLQAEGLDFCSSRC